MSIKLLLIFFVKVLYLTIALNIAGKVSGLGDGGAIEAQIFNIAQKLN
ncbi:hypothetical protein SAMN04488097_3614 [Epilithonimonas lactis]|nr:hypothetical protein SAMN04488097_3614 [Epilithonimonas lactis]